MSTTTRSRWGLEAFKDRMARSDLSAKLHARVFGWSGGRIGAAVEGREVLLLETTGRRSGVPRQVTLMFVRDGRRYLVVPSNASNADRPPAWWLNLSAHPRGRVLVDGSWQEVEAAALPPTERERRWPEMVEHNPNWGRFQDETSRLFPVVALSPVGS